MARVNYKISYLFFMIEKQLLNLKNISRPAIGLVSTGAFDEYDSIIRKSILNTSNKNNINFLCFAGRELEIETDSERQKNIIYKLVNKNVVNGLIIPAACFSNYINNNKLFQFIESFYPIPIVIIGMHIKGIPSILIDNKSGMRELMTHLTKMHKYKRIAFIRGPKSNPEAETRFKIYKEALSKYNIPYENKLVVQGDFTITSKIGGKAVSILLDKRKIHFDALVCCNDILAMDAIDELKNRGIRIPDDIAVTGFDDISESYCITPPLTTVHQPINKLGEEAFRILLGLLNNKNVPDKIILSTELVIRRSCGCFVYPGLKTINKNNISRKKIIKNNIKETIIKEIKNDKLINLFNINENPAFLNNTQLLFELLLKTIKKTSRTFLLTLEKLILEGVDNGIDTLSWNIVISKFLHFIKIMTLDDDGFFNDLCNDSSIIIGNIADRLKSYHAKQKKNQEFQLYQISSSFLSCFDINQLKKIIINSFPKIGINSCYLCIYTGKNIKYAKLLVGYDNRRNIFYNNENKKFLSKNLVPDNIKFDDKNYHFTIIPLFFKHIQLGFILIDAINIDNEIYEILSIQLSSALRGIQLMNKIKKHSTELEKKVKERTIKLEDANEKLKKLDELKNDFIANITHDFRSPLTAILNITDLALKYNSLNIETKENYNVIYKASLRLKKTIDRLLDLAKMDAQGLKLKIKKVELKSLLNKILDFYTSSILGSGIKIIKKLPHKNIDNFYTDVEKLEEIIDNIISNAIKFVNPNTGIITVELKENNNLIYISISDNGIGIPRNKLNSIFNRFEQAHEGRNSKYHGTGIGLAFAKQLVEYLKGNIWAESDGEGKGAKFIVQLKKGKNIFNKNDFDKEDIKEKKRDDQKKIIVSEIETKLEDKNLQTYITEKNKENENDFKKGIILIVDDDKNIRDIVMKYLIKQNYKNFITASDGKQGLEAVYEYSPDIIICDYNMPNIKGDEFHNQLLSNPRFCEIPFIFLSAVADENLIIERRQKGANAYLKKPIDEKILLITVDEHLKKYFEHLKIIKLATIDELTGLNNRRSIVSHLKHELAIRKYRDLSLIFFDLDYFKEINDNYGHQIGDKILALIGNITKSTIRNYDIAGRYGGDEFIIILPETNQEKAKIVADILHKTIINSKIIHQESELLTSSSFGIASLRDNASYIEKTLNIDSLENIYEINNSTNIDWAGIEKIKEQIAEVLLKMADIALYKAKKTICNKCGFSTEKYQIFINNKCPKCNSDDLIIGRNKVVVFEE